MVGIKMKWQLGESELFTVVSELIIAIHHHHLYNPHNHSRTREYKFHTLNHAGFGSPNARSIGEEEETRNTNPKI